MRADETKLRKAEESPLRILYVGDLKDGTTSKSRFEAICRLGHTVGPVATDPSRSPFQIRLLSRIAFVAGYPLDLARAKQRILAAVRSKTWDVLWVDEVKTMDRTTLAEVRHIQPAIQRVAFIMDDPFSKHARGWRRFRNAVRSYDIHCVIRHASIPELQECGARRVLRYHKGFDPQLHRPVPVPPNMSRMPLFFAGHWEPKREADLAALIKAGLPLYLSGHADWRKGHFWRVLQPHFHEGGFYGERYAEAICAADIALCFYSQWNRDTENSRMYEIPACGTFMLAERNEENIRLFEEGLEAEFFGNANELIEKVWYYFNNAAARIAVARTGYARCRNSGYAYDERMMGLLQEIRGAS